MMRRRIAMTAGAALAVSLLLATTGCAAKPPAANTTAVTPMDATVRRATLAAGFPPQVPVPAGRLVASDGHETANGDGIWTYTVDVASGPPTVAAWFASALSGLNWDVTKPTTSAEGVVEQEFTKGSGAQVRIRVTPQADGGSRVVTSVSIGIPVTPAQ